MTDCHFVQNLLKTPLKDEVAFSILYLMKTLIFDSACSVLVCHSTTVQL